MSDVGPHVRVVNGAGAVVPPTVLCCFPHDANKLTHIFGEGVEFGAELRALDGDCGWVARVLTHRNKLSIVHGVR
eukprot:2416078-Alexandrium_andersonii.AAC.1